ncbi:tripartite tricarboxylate transporter substrate binding protein [Variovorax sp. dw_954]|uniref:Bug family tripartite tricarboxylate transporter substrate binding protein n=1 Tax=Variovorax sp. dw_954 TaxID=2720078 RepID=UPI001BD3116C|nr:tripartite tricarboxylate transporter substrate binding protein [Variovorax sp. dw_954]
MTNNMTLSRRRMLASAVLLAAAPWQAVRADQPIRLVAPFSAGGGTDVIGRLLAQGLGKELGTTVIVDNLAGATGTIGAAQVARAAPDGRTLLLGPTATMAIAPALFHSLRYDTAKDFIALAPIAHGGNVVAANPGYPANTVPEMVALARRTGEPVVYASWGNGSAGHLAMESIRALTGIKTEHVPYKGAGPLVQDLIGGQVQVGMVDLAGALPQIRAGKIKALAVTGRKRSSALPQVPTLAEGGIAFDTESWYGLFGPARMPDAEAQKIAQAAEKVLRQPELIARIKDFGLDPEPMSRADFDKEWRADMVTWARLVQQSGAKVD